MHRRNTARIKRNKFFYNSRVPVALKTCKKEQINFLFDIENFINAVVSENDPLVSIGSLRYKLNLIKFHSKTKNYEYLIWLRDLMCIT